MTFYKHIRKSYLALMVAGLVVLSGCGGGSGSGGSGGGGSSSPASPLQDGVFTVVNFHGDKTGGIWDVDSSAFDVDLADDHAVYVDSDRDGEFDDLILPYEVFEDGTLTVDGDSVGVFSEDESTISTTDVTSTDYMDFAIGIREGTGMSVDTFNGPYLVTKFATNTSLDITHTYAVAATETGHGIGAFAVAQSSDPAATGARSAFHYSIEDNGNIFFSDSHEEGKIKSDGSFFIAGNTDTTDNIESIMFGIPLDESGSMTSADLEGEYIANLIGRNLVTGDYWTARILATFDGLGIVRYEFLDHTAGGGGATGYLAYRVYNNGMLLVGPPLEYGAVSPDGNTFCVVDTDTSDGQIYMMVGFKRQS